MATSGARIPRVVIVGAGFGGLTAAQSLKDAAVDLAVIDRNNHHLFQPLLYQVAMAGLSPAEIAAPIRGVIGSQHNTRVIMSTVTGADLAARVVHTDDASLPYDYLVLAAGARTSYFGHDEWERHAPGLKSIEDATEIRRRVLTAFEAAEKCTDEVRVAELLTFVVIGGGPTGVELAGAIAELSSFVLDRDFRRIRAGSSRTILVEGGARILAGMHEESSSAALAQLKTLGVEVITGERVSNIDEHGVNVGQRRIAAGTVLWAAGVEASPLGRALGLPVDRAGRVLVEPDLSVKGQPDVFVIGDMAAFTHQDDGKPLPGVSPVAMQQARHVAKTIVSDGQGRPRQPFHYVDKGSMATIGRSRAVAETGPFRLRGLLAWVAWLTVHIWYLIGFRNRLVVMLNWAWSYIAFKRGARLIVGPSSRPAPSTLRHQDPPAAPAAPPS